MPFDRATFYDALRHGTLFDRGLSARQVQGTEALLDAWDKSGLTDDRWLAYILGTAYHETGRAMFPVREGGKGKGHPYGVANAGGQVGYGRGFVQLTWNGPAPKPDNYARADKALGLGGKLVADNDLALDPGIAAQVIIRGMTEAWFTSFRLADYLNDHLADYLHARRIVNGMDKAETIAGYALVFFAAIQAGARKAADHSVVAKGPASAPADPLSALADALERVTDSVGSLLPAGGPSPAAPAVSPATTESTTMNPLVAISIIQQVMTYAPMVEHFLAEVPDIIKDGEAAIAHFKAMDFTDGMTDVKAIVDKLGITQGQLANVIGHATKNAPPAVVAKA